VIAILAGVLMLAAVLVFRPPRGAAARFRRATGGSAPLSAGGAWSGPRGRFRPGARKAATAGAAVSMTLVVQQLAALLKGGRTPGRLWEELWFVYGAVTPPGSPSTAGAGVGSAPQLASTSYAVQAGGRPPGGLSRGSVVVLAAARAAAGTGTPVSEAIRRSLPAAFPRPDREFRIWSELSACFDIAEASGCPLADVLTRFAAQLEVEDDADAARQTALAGPKATVSLLTWLPLMGLGLGIALGVDPLAILLGTPLGLAALAAGILLTVAGRVWSAKLVAAAAGAGVP
jgi:tight adherence protein B